MSRSCSHQYPKVGTDQRKLVFYRHQLKLDSSKDLHSQLSVLNPLHPPSLHTAHLPRILPPPPPRVHRPISPLPQSRLSLLAAILPTSQLSLQPPVILSCTITNSSCTQSTRNNVTSVKTRDTNHSIMDRVTKVMIHLTLVVKYTSSSLPFPPHLPSLTFPECNLQCWQKFGKAYTSILKHSCAPTAPSNYQRPLRLLETPGQNPQYPQQQGRPPPVFTTQRPHIDVLGNTLVVRPGDPRIGKLYLFFRILK